MPICLYIGLFSLFIQVCIFLAILFLFEDDFEWKVFTGMSKTLGAKIGDNSNDFKLLLDIFYNLGIKVIALDKYILLQENKARLELRSIPGCITCHDVDDTPIVLGISFGIVMNGAKYQVSLNRFVLLNLTCNLNMELIKKSPFF